MTTEPMTPERLAAIRARCRADVTSRWRRDVGELLAEIDRLRAVSGEIRQAAESHLWDGDTDKAVSAGYYLLLDLADRIWKDPDYA